MSQNYFNTIFRKKITITNFELFFLSRDHKIQIWSQGPSFLQNYFGYSKMDKKNVQNRKPKKTFPTIFYKF